MKRREISNGKCSDNIIDGGEEGKLIINEESENSQTKYLKLNTDVDENEPLDLSTKDNEPSPEHTNNVDIKISNKEEYDKIYKLVYGNINYKLEQCAHIIDHMNENNSEIFPYLTKEKVFYNKNCFIEIHNCIYADINNTLEIVLQELNSLFYTLEDDIEESKNLKTDEPIMQKNTIETSVIADINNSLFNDSFRNVFYKVINIIKIFSDILILANDINVKKHMPCMNIKNSFYNISETLIKLVDKLEEDQNIEQNSQGSHDD